MNKNGHSIIKDAYDYGIYSALQKTGATKLQVGVHEDGTLYGKRPVDTGYLQYLQTHAETHRANFDGITDQIKIVPVKAPKSFASWSKENSRQSGSSKGKK
jgi:hypothetical protein